jgi:molybdopterin/thiamine biosynthesis adenylyltransferase
VTPFDYDSAFSRNIGWVTREEQARLRGKRVAIAGLGGVGGAHLLTLTRLGIGAFHIADFDTFDLVNFNRQAGATVSHLGQPKLDVMAKAARDINPELELRLFAEGVTPSNLDSFLDGADLFVDGLDFFALDIRRQVFDACQARGIAVVTAAPLGMSAALLLFLPGGPSFEDYFRLEGASVAEKALRFLVGLAPGLLQRPYLADAAAVDLENRRGPSTVMACELCAGLAATVVLKLLLGRGPVQGVPFGTQFDAYRGKLVRTWRPGGNANPLNRLIIALAKRQLGI